MLRKVRLVLAHRAHQQSPSPSILYRGSACMYIIHNAGAVGRSKTKRNSRHLASIYSLAHSRRHKHAAKLRRGGGGVASVCARARPIVGRRWWRIIATVSWKTVRDDNDDDYMRNARRDASRKSGRRRALVNITYTADIESHARIHTRQTIQVYAAVVQFNCHCN